jgi:hypothetical protein
MGLLNAKRPSRGERRGIGFERARGDGAAADSRRSAREKALSLGATEAAGWGLFVSALKSS